MHRYPANAHFSSIIGLLRKYNKNLNMHKIVLWLFVLVMIAGPAYTSTAEYQQPLVHLDSYEDAPATGAGNSYDDEEVYETTLLQQQQEQAAGAADEVLLDSVTDSSNNSETNANADNSLLLAMMSKMKNKRIPIETNDDAESGEMATNSKEATYGDLDFDARKPHAAAPKAQTVSGYVRSPKVEDRDKQSSEAMRKPPGDEFDLGDLTNDDDQSDDTNSTNNMQTLSDKQTPKPMKTIDSEKQFKSFLGSAPRSYPTLRKQLLHDQNDNEEEYYEDSSESMERSNTLLKKNHLPVTTTTAATPSLRPSTSTSNIPQSDENSFKQPHNIAVAGFALPSFGKAHSENASPAAPGEHRNVSTARPINDGQQEVIPALTNLSNRNDADASMVVPPNSTTVAVGPTTTMRPIGKQGKQIKIQRRKLLAHEQLRNYIEDAYIRMPLAVIVDPSAESLEKTKTLWREALRKNFNIKIILVSLNASGIPAAYNFNNTRQFLDGLNSIKEHASGDAFIGIVHASELVPYDSAVFISTATVPPHTELVQDAAITLLKKRIRLYVIWYGERTVSENETQESLGGILGEVAIRSGGEILHIVDGEDSQELRPSPLTLVADAFRGSQEIDIPLDMSLSNLHIKIDTPMRLATMETNNGDINLKKMVKINSRTPIMETNENCLDAYVPLSKLRKPTVYQLRLTPESMDTEYSVFVRADRKPDIFIGDMIHRFDSYLKNGLSSYAATLHSDPLQNIASARLPTHASLVRFPEEEQEDMNSNNKPIYNQSFGDVYKNTPKQDAETFSDTEIQLSHNDKNTTLPGAQSIEDNKRVTQRTTNIFQSHATKIEMGTQSRLLVAPGAMSQLNFELTNTRDETVYHSIQVVDEKRYLLRLLPQSLYLRPGEKANVVVTVLVPSAATQGTVDKITLSCHGGTAVSSLSVNLKVLTPTDSRDTTAPTVSWTFGNRCDNMPNNGLSCAERFWTMDITTQDWESGVLRLQTNPDDGLLYRSAYTVGTTEPMRASYIATCCEPQMSLTAFDVAGNQRSYNIDVRHLYLTEAAIAAIALGALLLILLIVLAIWGIIWCCRRRQVSLDLPTYRSHSTRSME